MPKEQTFKTVPNQKIITVSKLSCSKEDKTKLYTVNRLDGISQAAARLQSKCGFKLYMYFSKHQDKYTFALSSADFTQWSGCSMTAYNTAINELIEQGYLVAENGNNYKFYDYSNKE